MSSNSLGKKYYTYRRHRIKCEIRFISKRIFKRLNVCFFFMIPGHKVVDKTTSQRQKRHYGEKFQSHGIRC